MATLYDEKNDNGLIPTIDRVRSSSIRDIADPILRQRVCGLIRSEPQFGRMSIRRVADMLGAGRFDAAIVIPARQELEFIGRAIEHAIRSGRATSARCALVIVVNNSADATYKIACASLAANNFPALVLDCRFDAAIADIGHARRFALDVAAACPGVRYLLSTDADGAVARDWTDRAIASLRHSDMVCGRVDTDPRDLAQLPDSVRICGEVEAQLRGALDALWIAVNGPSSRGYTNRGSGANMAMRAAAYRSVGGLPPVPSGEDRALHALFEVEGRSIRHDEGMCVTVSGRIHSTIGGGMAACLASRAQNDDPFVDSQLLTARKLLHHAILHRDGTGHMMQAKGSPMRMSKARLETIEACVLTQLLHAGAKAHDLSNDTAIDKQFCA